MIAKACPEYSLDKPTTLVAISGAGNVAPKSVDVRTLKIQESGHGHDNVTRDGSRGPEIADGKNAAAAAPSAKRRTTKSAGSLITR